MDILLLCLVAYFFDLFLLFLIPFAFAFDLELRELLCVLFDLLKLLLTQRTILDQIHLLEQTHLPVDLLDLLLLVRRNLLDCLVVLLALHLGFEHSLLSQFPQARQHLRALLLRLKLILHLLVHPLLLLFNLLDQALLSLMVNLLHFMLALYKPHHLVEPFLLSAEAQL